MSALHQFGNIMLRLGDIQHVERHNPDGLIVITKHTRWDFEQDCWANSVWIHKENAEEFLSKWEEFSQKDTSP